MDPTAEPTGLLKFDGAHRPPMPILALAPRYRLSAYAGHLSPDSNGRRDTPALLQTSPNDTLRQKPENTMTEIGEVEARLRHRTFSLGGTVVTGFSVDEEMDRPLKQCQVESVHRYWR